MALCYGFNHSLQKLTEFCKDLINNKEVFIMTTNEIKIGKLFTRRAKLGFYYRKLSFSDIKYITFRLRFLFINIEIEREIERI